MINSTAADTLSETSSHDYPYITATRYLTSSFGKLLKIREAAESDKTYRCLS